MMPQRPGAVGCKRMLAGGFLRCSNHVIEDGSHANGEPGDFNKHADEPFKMAREVRGQSHHFKRVKRLKLLGVQQSVALSVSGQRFPDASEKISVTVPEAVQRRRRCVESLELIWASAELADRLAKCLPQELREVLGRLEEKYGLVLRHEAPAANADGVHHVVGEISEILVE